MRMLLLLLAMVTAACGSHAATPAVSGAPVSDGGVIVVPADSEMLRQIQCAPAAVRDLPTDEIVAPGKIEANPNRVSKLVLPVAGRVVAVLARTGDAVVKGQPLLQIESPEADSAASAYLSAQAGVTQAVSARTKAQADYDRLTDLYQHDAVAAKEVLAAQAALTQAAAALDQARAAVAQASRRLQVLGLTPDDVPPHVIVRSPLTGKVLELSVVAGEYRNDLSAPVMTIADLETVWVTSQVPERYIRFIQPGERVQIELIAYPGEVFTGRVSRIADTVDPQTRSIKVQAEVDNHDNRLRPEMFASIHHIESTARTVVVPSGAVVQSAGRAFVYVQTAPGRFERRDVTLGRPAGDVVRVLSGVQNGEIVAVDGVMLLKGLGSRT
jgi:cobalt-zinc-cadmium efflux system membrane fusion protein